MFMLNINSLFNPALLFQSHSTVTFLIVNSFSEELQSAFSPRLISLKQQTKKLSGANKNLKSNIQCRFVFINHPGCYFLDSDRTAQEAPQGSVQQMILRNNSITNIWEISLIQGTDGFVYAMNIAVRAALISSRIDCLSVVKSKSCYQRLFGQDTQSQTAPFASMGV